jgi:hypothetical protein
MGTANRTLIRWAWLLALAGVSSAGCSASEWQQIQWPWQRQSVLKERYDVPPMDDARYSDPATFPKSTMTPTLRSPDDVNGRRPTMVGPGGAGGGRRGVGPVGGAAGMGGF